MNYKSKGKSQKAKINVKSFQVTVLEFWKREGRHGLPWRKTRDPYAILVSEIMLQQTQVDRVVPYFEKWMRKFPTVEKLAKASLSDVLKVWSGLGYNRRAKLLRECAKKIVEKHGGKIPKDFAALVALPAIGPYTASAVRVFAFNKPDVLIETNIRTVFFHHFPMFHKSNGRTSQGTITDGEILEIAKRAAKGQDPQTWHAALMDYGAHLKKSGVRLNKKSSHYVKQSRFEGSLRQFRGIILRRLLKGSVAESALLHVDVESSYFMEQAIRDLEREGLIEKKGKSWLIA